MNGNASPPETPAGLRAAWRKLTTPPAAAGTAAQSRRAVNLHSILLAVFAVYSVGLLVGVPFVFVRKLEGAAIMLLFLAVAALAWRCMRSGRVTLGCHLVAWSMWILSSALVLLSAQLYNAAMYVAPVFVIAVLFGPFWAVISGAAGIAVTFLGAQAPALGVALPKLFPAPPHAQAFVFGLQLAMGISAFYVILRRLDRALERADAELAERRLAGYALRESQHRLSLALEAARTGIWEWEVKSGRLVTTPQAEAVFGRQGGEFGNTYEDFLKLVHPDDAERVATFNIGILDGQPHGRSIEHRIVLADGSIRWIEGQGALVRDAAGNPQRVVGTVSDVTRRKLAEQALRASEERFARAFRSSPMFIAISTLAEGRYIDVNEAYERITGYHRDEVIGRTVAELGLWPDPDQRAALVRILRERGRVERREVRLRRKSGEILICELWAESLELDGTECLLTVTNDVTESRRADDALRLRIELDALILRISRRFLVAPREQTAGAILETLADVGRFAAADRCYTSRLDESGDTYTLADEWCAEGIPSKRAVRQAVPSTMLWSEVERNQIAYVTASELPPDSAVRHTIASAGIQSSLRVAIRSAGQLVGVLGLDSVRREKRWSHDVELLLRVVADIVGGALLRERADAEIRRLNADLERRVAERTRELEATNRELEAFSYSVSHDLRGSLRRIEGFTRILAMQHGARLGEQAGALLARVRSLTLHMGRLIDDLLKLARVNRHELVRVEVDLSATAREAFADLAAAEPERRVEWTVADGLVATADRGLIRVVLDNLIGNAWKYTGRTPLPRIEFGATQIDGETACYVRDNGTGFDMAHAANLFGAFQRLHTRDEFEGTGIGLATVQRIITRHGGRVWADSAPGRGATFYFTLGNA